MIATHLLVSFTPEVLKNLAKSTKAKEVVILHVDYGAQRYLVFNFGKRNRCVLIPEFFRTGEFGPWLNRVIDETKFRNPRHGASRRPKMQPSIKSKVLRCFSDAALHAELSIW
jgi:hypothetical protein